MRHILVALLALASPALAVAQPSAIAKIRSTKIVAMAYRTNALPFSFRDANGQPAGYTVDLCKRIAVSMQSSLNIPDLKIRWVEATSQNRFELIEKHEADMECGASTATLQRMERVDFSSYVFIDSTGVLARRAAGIQSFSDLAGKRIAAIAGTTNEQALRAALKHELIDAKVVTQSSREAAVAALDAGKVDAFASDKILLEGISGKLKDTSNYILLPDNLSLEPYAIMLPRDDSALRLEVNRGLSQVFSSGAIKEIFARTFGRNADPTPLLRAVYTVGYIPD
jgi:glutamate/aspartate transport system substrate-binding protein